VAVFNSSDTVQTVVLSYYNSERVKHVILGGILNLDIYGNTPS
jgi:hypothetical protein